ncbi:Hok/Gef family protein [Vagococcus sp. WN89Y]|uniref:Hok/Gef family protein n=1 Tax=Vagococcus sp. WN89Y TaxID=3457258 RepID=UPI003FCE7B3F
MPYKYLLFSLMVKCLTILLFTLLIRDSLCGLHLRQGNIELVAFLACEVKQ